MLETRTCPVCASTRSELVFQQEFATLPGIENFRFRQRIVCCEDCGMIYVDEYLPDSALSKYYSAMSSYEYPECGYDYPQWHRKRSQRQFEFITQHKRNFRRVLDVGCSIGYTLSLFKQSGAEVLGIEPSPKLKEVAKRLYDVDVRAEFMLDGFEMNDTFDLIILSHIAEHLKKPTEVISSLSRNLTENALLFIEVPTIEEFDERDPAQFSFEHINYFSHGSLTNLMHRVGFDEVNHVIFENDDGTAPFYPTLGTLWRKSGDAPRPLINRRPHDRKVIARYVDLVSRHVQRLHDVLNPLVGTGRRIAIWGGGTLTAQLLAQTPLGSANVVVIYDSDPKKAGLALSGIPIKNPGPGEDFLAEDEVDVVLIGSWSSQDEIYRTLLDRGVKEEMIVRLFQSD